MDPILLFSGKYRFLSNFYPSPLSFPNRTYPTVEHAFQAFKTLDQSQRDYIASLPDPGQAKKAGRRVPLRSDWEDIKLDVMYVLVKKKFVVYSDLRTQLLETGTAYLEEGNTWGDTFWGVCNRVGENHLGKTLMIVRKELSS